MSFSHYEKKIDYGHTVILYIGFENLLQFEVTKGRVHQTKYGAIKHDQLFGVEFGSKLQLTRGYVYILHPTPELWTMSLNHRTQILYSTDISLIVYLLDLKPGSIVVESGTGSASLSHAILRTVYPMGHLHTFDFHSQRVETARKEFESHGFNSQHMTIKCQDVCKDGFDLSRCVDALFLDLPTPWLAVPHAKEALRNSGRIGSFSPCIEQVQRTCEALMKHGFVDVQTFECLQRSIEVRTAILPCPDLGFGPGKYYSGPGQNLSIMNQNLSRSCNKLTDENLKISLPNHNKNLKNIKTINDGNLINVEFISTDDASVTTDLDNFVSIIQPVMGKIEINSQIEDICQEMKDVKNLENKILDSKNQIKKQKLDALVVKIFDESCDSEKSNDLNEDFINKENNRLDKIDICNNYNVDLIENQMESVKFKNEIKENKSYKKDENSCNDKIKFFKEIVNSSVYIDKNIDIKVLENELHKNFPIKIQDRKINNEIDKNRKKEKTNSLHDYKNKNNKQQVKGKNILRNCKANYVTRSGMPSMQITGHTGFLTFATLYSS